MALVVFASAFHRCALRARPVSSPSRLGSARRPALLVLAGALALGLAGCGDQRFAGVGLGSAPAPAAAPAASAPGARIGEGPVKVAMLLPLSASGQGAQIAASMRNAAELGLSEFGSGDVTVIIKDDRGTAEGAAAAAQEALAEGAELILGPVFAPAVAAVTPIARGANRPVIAFSTDPGVAQRGTYLLSFLAEGEVTRAVSFAASRGKRSFAAMVPEGAYGNLVLAAFQETAARAGARVVAIERFSPDANSVNAAATRLGPIVGGASPSADALFLPVDAGTAGTVGQALASAGFNPQRVKPIGTGVWNDPALLRAPAVQGGWFAAPDPGRFATFAGKYQARFGAAPRRNATLAYDAVQLAAALARTQGSQRYSEPVLTSASGITGADGLFRFRPDGTNQRGLSVLEVRNGSSAVVAPAPQAFDAGT